MISHVHVVIEGCVWCMMMDIHKRVFRVLGMAVEL